MIALGLLGVLGVMLVIQGPRILDAFGGSSSPSAASRLVPTPAAPDENARPPALRFKGNGTDPFAARSLADNDPKAAAVAGPDGAKDPFVNGAARDPGSPNAERNPDPVAQALPGKIVVGTPRSGAVAKQGWIVVLASIRTGAGRQYAERFATRVRLNGLASVSVLDSSSNKPLRSGYFVVYTGPFATLADVQRSAAHVHAFGYRTAYIREILRY